LGGGGGVSNVVHILHKKFGFIQLYTLHIYQISIIELCIYTRQ
jgi:hypothetical protein